MTPCHRDLGRLLVLVAGTLLLACSPVPSEVETAAGSGSEDSTTGIGPGEDTTDTSTTNTNTGPSFDPVCGDGIVEDPEECDLGPLNGEGMYCTNLCTSNVCGDGYLGPGEACDDGNQNDEDQCTTLCGLATCGDGAIQAGEECDEGKDNSQTGACLPSCIAASCGDLFIQEGEEMCDGNNTAGASCMTEGFERGTLLCSTDCEEFDTSNCHLCGNDIIEPSEDCDGTNYTNNVTCTDFAPMGTTPSGGALACTNGCTNIDSSACTYCGDGLRQGTEACDTNQFGANTCATFAPGGTTPSGGALSCTNACIINSSACTYCGDQVREGTELCDGDELNGQTCQSQGFAPGGTLECTPGCTFDTSGCNACGNGMINGAEQCDGANLNGGTCAGVLGVGHGGTLSCEDDCTYDTSMCCRNIGQSCMGGGQCCSGNCIAMLCQL